MVARAGGRLLVPKPKPASVAEFLLEPTEDQWNAELLAGWLGPDGSSNSLDDIEGIRIGITSRSYAYHALAANGHDWLYQNGRRHKLGPEFRAAADAWYRDRCIRITDKALVGWRVYAARARAWTRYYALRSFGEFAWTSAP